MLTGGRKATDLKSYDSNRTPIAPAPKAPAHRSKKDTKRWCKGRVGVEHQAEWVDSSVVRGYENTPQLQARQREWDAERKRLIAAGHRVFGGTEILVCGNCGRHLDWRRK